MIVPSPADDIAAEELVRGKEKDGMDGWIDGWMDGKFKLFYLICFV